MNRRDFLRRATLLVAAGVAADQIDLLERLTWKRTLFPSAPLSQQIQELYVYSHIEDGSAVYQIAHWSGDTIDLTPNKSRIITPWSVSHVQRIPLEILKHIDVPPDELISVRGFRS